ncbi:MAG: lytic transglycosylase domain-containing protein [Bacteroidales bacterium]|jgi:membrane-bound lytic murein transglycosylase MltF|nr:lytic transglycosylase domain-containing protein [Bacteroidales bacterium]MCI1785186.1 lytic transglycosylase domain-containing protein [Bacteroidales bacterium]
MAVNLKYKRILRYVIPTIIILLIIPFFEKARLNNHKKRFTGKSVVCVLGVSDDKSGGKGFKAGYSYEMLKKFAKDDHFEVTIKEAEANADYLDSIKLGTIDIYVMEIPDSLPGKDVVLTSPIGENIVWAIKYNKKMTRLKEANLWLAHYLSSEENKMAFERFFADYDPYKRKSSGKEYIYLSPYDKIIEKYSGRLGWDWRLIAAMVYQESHYEIDNRSGRGAVGLMQIMPRTATRYDTDDLLDPEENIKTGISHLARLQKIFRKYADNKNELVKMTLAAYNAGEGRILDCINYAAISGNENGKWEELVKVIPDMRLDSILQEDTVKLGKFHGYETIGYVEKVSSIYDIYKAIHPSIHSYGIGGIDSGNKERRNQ